MNTDTRNTPAVNEFCSTAPPTLSRTRLAQALGMMGSAHDGEALNAARLVDRMVRDSGKTWATLLEPVVSLLPQEPMRQRTPNVTRACRLICDHQHDLTGDELATLLEAVYRGGHSKKIAAEIDVIAQRMKRDAMPMWGALVIVDNILWTLASERTITADEMQLFAFVKAQRGKISRAQAEQLLALDAEASAIVAEADAKEEARHG